MEMKRSKIFKIKNQDLNEDTAFEREFRVAVVNHHKTKKEEKIILVIGILLMFLISIFGKNPTVRGVGGAMTFVFGLLGILL